MRLYTGVSEEDETIHRGLRGRRDYTQGSQREMRLYTGSQREMRLYTGVSEGDEIIHRGLRGR